MLSRHSWPPLRGAAKLGLALLLTGSCAFAQPDELTKYDQSIKPSDREHWAFKQVKTPAVPKVRDTAWVRNPIDAFALAKLEAKDWKPSPPAEARALVRRMYLDLVGLPPSIAEQEQFLKDPTPAAFDRLIDDLLARPQYGERWARHWLDLARYADSNGYERDALKPSVWRFRDYVIRALNDDKPYDRFVLEQLAGDELPDGTTESVIATSFLRLGPWDDEPADPAADRFDQLDDIVSTTSQVFLGLTLACARCHDHKFEPLTMHDYYRAVAIFDPLKRPQNGRTDLDVPAVPLSMRDAFAERERKVALLLKQGNAARAAASSAGGTYVSRALERFAIEFPAPERGYFFQELSPAAPETRLLVRGSASRPTAKVAPGLPAVLVDKQPEFLPSAEHTTQRRLTFAKWVASKDNPLTARVIVNRVWQFHFGEGIVRTPSDFGVNGEGPTHPELLDWLAAWFVNEGWSLKKLHRLILTSNTWRMNKRFNAEYAAIDPENHLLWRVPYRRLEVEAIRDSVLAVSGRLNPEMFGPGAFLPIPKEALEGNSDPATVWKPSDEKTASRRTIYAVVKRALGVPLLDALDLCDTARSSAKRSVTTVAPQALMLFNGEFVNKQAAYLAERLEKEAGLDAAMQIDLAYRLLLCRPPTDAETTRLLRFLNAGASRTQMCRVLLNLNEFVYPD